MNLRKEFSEEEWKYFVQASDAHGFFAVLLDWGMIVAALVTAVHFPNPLVFLLSMMIIGGRQLALAICVHDCAHYSLFKTKRLNDVLGKWLCGAPVWQSLYRYRKHHLKHHQWAGSKEDPDYSLVSPFPLNWKSFVRKTIRDLTGITGIKRIIGLIQMDFGFLTYTAAADPKPIPKETRAKDWFLRGLFRMAPVVLCQGIFLAVLSFFDVTWIYGLWVGAYLIFFSVFVRIRSIAEHACMELDLDPIRSTRTTRANFFARITVAPHYVNYHLEHHLLMSVPHFRFKELHRFLKKKNLIAQGKIADGYFQVLRLAITR